MVVFLTGQPALGVSSEGLGCWGGRAMVGTWDLHCKTLSLGRASSHPPLHPASFSRALAGSPPT